MCVHGSIEPLSWESDFFQVPSAKLFLSPSSSLVTLKNLDAFSLVQAKVQAQQVDIMDKLSSLGFRLVEGEIDLSLSIDFELSSNDSLLFPSSYQVRYAMVDDIPLLRTVAQQVFVLSRFRSPWYQVGDSGRFYATWLEKAVLGTFDDCCLLVADPQHEIQGFVTLRTLEQSEARVGLLAVFPKSAGKGVGHFLMLAAKHWCQQQGIRCLRIATQVANVAALRLYIRHGASIESTAYWLYRRSHDSV